MNEIERIKEVMQIIRTKHMCEDMDDKCTQQDRLDYRERFAALKTAIAALQEKAERDKGCEYCDKETNECLIDDGDTAIFIVNGHVFHAGWGGSDYIPWMFCPMCGRKLEVKHEG